MGRSLVSDSNSSGNEDFGLLLGALTAAIWELGEALTGMPSEDLWTRPHPRLLSVGELCVHIGGWLSVSFLGTNGDGPLAAHGGAYYPDSIEKQLTLPMTTEELYAEIKRVHEAGVKAFQAEPHRLDDANPNRDGWIWKSTVEYQGFHVAYHTGQIYSVRHMLGHQTVDN